MINQKLPEPGEWWISYCDAIAYICGFDPDGDPVFLTDRKENAHVDTMSGFLENWHHEPLCTGWDWKPPAPIDPGEGWELLPVGTMLQDGDECFFNGTWHELNRIFSGTVYDTEDKNHYRRRKQTAEQWPKYFIHSDQTCRWYIKRISETNCQYVSCSGEHDSDEWTGYSDYLVDSGTWREVTEAEALARVKPAEPAAAESPDDWVETTDPEYVLRAAIDEVWYSVENIGSEWQQVYPSAGMKLGDSQYEKARCRRRDLPALQPKTMDVSPGEGWRWVEKDEPWQEGDDCLICDFKHAHTHNCQCWRRRIVPQPKRTPVRLFVSADVRWGDRYIVSVKDGNPNPERHQEIKFDGSGFYVEGGE